MKPTIICTLGTTTDDNNTLTEMVNNGMSCARLNTAYSSCEDYKERIDRVREVSQDLFGTPDKVDIMMDIKGPQVRLVTDGAYKIEQHSRFIVGFDDDRPIHFSKDFYKDVSRGDNILFENGDIKTRVLGKRNNSVTVEVLESYEESLRNCIGVNVPGKYLNVPKLSEKDLEVIDFSVQQNVDYIALSFVRDYDDVSNLQNEIIKSQEKYNSSKDIGIIAKIEDINGLTNLPDILTRSKEDNINLSVMIARGDLYVELPKEDLPFAQEQMIRTCNEENIYVIAASRFLESMQYSPEPTGAEVCDVYNAIRSGITGPDAIMLSGETSNSHYPVEAVRTLNGIIQR